MRRKRKGNFAVRQMGAVKTGGLGENEMRFRGWLKFPKSALTPKGKNGRAGSDNVESVVYVQLSIKHTNRDRDSSS